MISEEDLENDVITPEILPEKKFQVMIKEASLDESRANYLLQNFSGHFKEAAEWARKSKDIIVTNDNQTVMMEMARTGRLFLAKKRQEIEKARKWMKEPALREGQAIDKIANLLKDTIIPTEQHLLRQERFVELKKEAEEARLLAEVQTKMEADRIAKEEADRKALEIAQAENERLRNEQKKIEAENARKIEEERKARQVELDRVRKEQEEILRIEREKNAIVERELLRKKQEELKAEAEKIRAEERAKSAGDTEKLLTLRNALEAIFIPEVQSIQSKRIISEVTSHLYLAKSKIKITQEEE